MITFLSQNKILFKYLIPLSWYNTFKQLLNQFNYLVVYQ